MTQISCKDTVKNKYSILGTRIDVTSYEDATSQIITWAKSGISCYICAANVHMVMEGYDDHNFMKLVNSAALVSPDGMPLVWGLRWLGAKGVTRVYGPTLSLHVCRAAADHYLPVALYGGTERSLSLFKKFLHDNFPHIHLVCEIAPPFRALTEEEDDFYTQQIVASGAKIVFVGIGCPKQEKWMAAHQNRISAVMIGVGAAFDFHSGQIRQAPAVMQKCGLEWLFRLCMEPRRLWKRYLKQNPRFIYYFVKQYLHCLNARFQFK